MHQSSTETALPSQPNTRDESVPAALLLLVVALSLGLRLLHMRFMLPSPLNFQRGPDEEYYLRFGAAVASGASSTAEFAFMDPAYGYVLGMVFKLFGSNVFVINLLQALVDTLTAVGIFLIGRELGRPRGGLIGALLYGVACTAIYFSATLLKATWVANFVTFWVLFGLVLLRKDRPLNWVLFGLFCGYGVALRANLILMTGLSVVLLAWLRSRTPPRPSARRTAVRLALLGIGLALPLALLSARNYEISRTLSPIPTNGGVVLHHLYNPENPRAAIHLPSFVTLATPSQIWIDYSREAQHRLGHPMSAREIERYWRSEALAYIATHPVDFAENIGRKLLEFFAYTEVPNNRSLVQDRLFSPVLRVLPVPFGWFIAFGLPGLVVLLYRDRRAVLLAAPILVAAATVAVFFSEDRFRFHAVPILALCAGLFVEDLFRWIRARSTRQYVIGSSAALMLGTSSVVLATHFPQPQLDLDRVIWGYLKMNNKSAIAPAKALAEQVAVEQPNNGKVQEALGYIAAVEGRYADAVTYYTRTVVLRPNDHAAHYNLARMLVKTGDRSKAVEEATTAARLEPLPEYQQLVEQLSMANSQR